MAILPTVPETLARTARKYPDREAIVYPRKAIRWTYQEFDARVNRFANALIDLGIETGDRVSLFMQNSAETGAHRSAPANRMVFRNLLESNVNISVTSNKDDHRPAGFAGGRAGVRASSDSSNGEKDVPTNGRVVMEPDETLTFDTATPGGYGDPTDRDDELVERDVRMGYITPERAADVYGYEEK